MLGQRHSHRLNVSFGFRGLDIFSLSLLLYPWKGETILNKVKEEGNKGQGVSPTFVSNTAPVLKCGAGLFALKVESLCRMVVRCYVECSFV